MAGEDSGGLLVQIGVTQARMERELAKLVNTAAKSAGDMEKSFDAANNNIGKGAQRAFGGVTKGAQQAAPAVKNLNGYTSNLASQLNDIGVQLAGGQSPFLIMLQQGTQISQIFSQTGGTIKSFGSLLAGAAMSALNPFSLLTFAVIGLGGTAIQYFADLIGGSADANKAIEEQRKLVEGVAKAWGEAVPALQAYVDELARAKDIGELNQVTEQRKTQVWDDIRAQLVDFNDEYGRTISLLVNTEFDNKAVQDLGQAYDELKEKIENGTATTEDFQRVAQMTDAAAASGIGGLDEFAGAFAGLSQFIMNATQNLAAWQKQAAGAIMTKYPSQGTYSGVDRSPDGRMGGTGTVLPETGPVPGDKPSTEGQYAGGTWKKPKSGGGSKRGANSYKDEVAGIKERTAALRESTAAQASVNPLISDYGFALEKAKAEQKLLADAQRAGMAITPALKEQISALAEGYATASADAKKLSESQKDIQKNAQEWASLEKDVFKGFISDLKDGKSGAEALSNALNKVADKLLDMAVDGLFSTKGGATGGSGLFGSILGGIGKIFGFASGTAKTPGRRGQPAGVVHGQEAVIPLPAGGKVPVTISSPTVQKSKGSNDLVRLVLQDDSGRMADVADQRIQTASGAIVQVSVEQSFRTVKANMGGLITDTQSRQF